MPMSQPDAEEQWETFLSRYLPEIQEQARECRSLMQARLPGAVEMVYDNYNALVIGYGRTEKASEALFSLALFPRWITLCFLRGHLLDDPRGLLRGEGKLVRNIRLTRPDDLNGPEIRAFIDAALEIDGWPPRSGDRCRLVIKSISPKQRPRVPSGPGGL